MPFIVQFQCLSGLAFWTNVFLSETLAAMIILIYIILVATCTKSTALSCTEIQTRMQGTQSKQYSSTLDCFKQILSKEGMGAFYAGIVPRLGRVVPGQGIIFMSFETIVQNLEQFTIFQ